MKNLMPSIICSDIRIIELKLKRIKHYKERLLIDEPSRLNFKKYKDWELTLQKIETEEINITKELQNAYIDLEEYI